MNRIGFFVGIFLSFAPAACSAGPEPAPTEDGDTAASLEAAHHRHDAGAASDGGHDAAAPSFVACARDTDCVAVRAAPGCCNNGRETAINVHEADAWKRANACTARDMCPDYYVHDGRVPECNHATRTCEMVAIDAIRCGGFVRDPHECPSEMTCEITGRADVPGRCVRSR